MVTINVKNIEGKTVIPVAGTQIAAGYDIVTIDDPIIVGEVITKEEEFFPFYSRIDYIEYHTALYISPIPNPGFNTSKDNYHTLLHPRSSIRKYNLILANSIGLVDNDYRGEIILCFKYIWQPEDFIIDNGKLLGKLNRDKIYKKGDKIGQLVAEKTNPIEFILVNDLDITHRGEGGFGSTDKPKIIFTENKPVENISTEIKVSSETKGIFGTIVDKYKNVGGVPIKRKYSEEVKERNKIE